MTMLANVSEEAPAAERPQDEHIIELATAAAHGNDAAFVELYELFSQRVFNLVLRSVHDRGIAEDLCQEIWLKVHHEIRSLRAPEAIRSWLYRIATRACIDFARSSRARASDAELVDEFVQAYDPMPEDAAIHGSQVRMVWETLATMAPRQSIALYLKQVDGRSYDEISSILNCSRETVESLLFRARQSFVRAYDRVQSSPTERCNMFQQVVAGIVDEEPTQLQKSAIHAHMQECRACRGQLPEMAAAAKGYAMLPLLPITKGLVLETILGTAAAGGAIVAPAATGGVVAGLSLKAKLAALLGLLAMGATGAATTNVVNVPLIPDVGAIIRNEDSPAQDDQLVLGDGRDGATVQQGLGDGSTTGSSGPAAGRSIAHDGGPGAVGRREPGSAGANGGGSAPSSNPAPPAAPGAPVAGSDSTPVSGGGSGGDAGLGGPVGSLVEGTVDLLDGLTGGALGSTLTTLDGTLAQLDGTLNSVGQLADDTLGSLGETVDGVLEPLDPLLDGLTGGVVDDTLDTLLPPPGSDEPGPVQDVLDGVDDTLDDLLPGGGEEDGGLLGGLLDPLLPPSGNPPPSATEPPPASPPPAATPPPAPPCLLVILC